MASRTKRRQAAALVVQGFFSVNKKSTAQPRPAVHVPPRGIGPVVEPNPNDVLCGRGGRINAHEGNIQFRDIVAANKKEYLAKTTKKLEKAHIAARIVEAIRTMDPPGRFLKEETDGCWYDIGDAKAIKKAGQALREDAPDIRDDDSDEEGDISKKTSTKGDLKKAETSKRTTTPTDTSGANGRGSQQQLRSTHSGVSSSLTGGSSYGMPYPQHQPPVPPPAYSSSMGSFPQTASIGSAQHSLTGPPVFGNPAQRIQNVMSKTAVEMMKFQQQPFVANHHQQQRQQQQQQRQQQQRRQNRQQQLCTSDPDESAFGRNFTPTEFSSGSTVSTISGMSRFSNTGSNMTGSQFGTQSALSLGSSGLYSLPASAGNSLRMQQPGQNHQGSRGGASRGSSKVSDTASSFINSSGLARSRSFGDLSTTWMNLTEDSSREEMMAEDKLAENILASMAPPDASGTAHRSYNDRIRNHTQSSAMSLASYGSNKAALSLSMRSVGSDKSWLHPDRREETGGANWDEQSMMSDVSESLSLVALDLARPPQFYHQTGV